MPAMSESKLPVAAAPMVLSPRRAPRNCSMTSPQMIMRPLSVMPKPMKGIVCAQIVWRISLAVGGTTTTPSTPAGASSVAFCCICMMAWEMAWSSSSTLVWSCAERSSAACSCASVMSRSERTLPFCTMQNWKSSEDTKMSSSAFHDSRSSSAAFFALGLQENLSLASGFSSRMLFIKTTLGSGPKRLADLATMSTLSAAAWDSTPCGSHTWEFDTPLRPHAAGFFRGSGYADCRALDGALASASAMRSALARQKRSPFR
mmetsp:Transcript_33272/g.68690  ORF Transcript_33272/g.68690 Transcript_33272/m.68690 type:complete len:260 (+) Transcript_33272:364-1143(+)